MRDPYDVLGVSKSASAAEIKSAFRRQAKKLRKCDDRQNRRRAHHETRQRAGGLAREVPHADETVDGRADTREQRN